MLLRGYYEGRYRDKQYLAAQAEDRLPLWWRFGAAASAGVGDVAPDLGSFRVSTLKPSYGLGLRFMINQNEKVNNKSRLCLGERNQWVLPGNYRSILRWLPYN